MNRQMDAHGGNIYKEARLQGLRKQDILDYSANINPFGVPESLKELIRSSLDDLANYPDPEYTELKEDIAKYHEISLKNILVGNGASEIIFLLFDTLAVEKVLIPAPTFSEYGKAAQAAGAEVLLVERKEEEEFRLDVDALLHAVDDKTGMVMLCNPNNPTSTLAEPKDLLRLVEQCRKKGVWVVIDEAFIELTEGGEHNSLVKWLNTYSNLFIIRAFTKYYAIPGLRLGYGLGPEELIHRMAEKKLPWSVNSLAACVGKILTTDTEYRKKTEAWLKEELLWMHRQLQDIKGFTVYKPSANFILVKITAGLDAGLLRERMLSRGILIRHAGNFAFLDNRYFRVAVKDRKSNLRFMEVLKQVLEKGV